MSEANNINLGGRLFIYWRPVNGYFGKQRRPRWNIDAPFHLGLHWAELQLNVHYMYLEIMTCDPLNHIMDDPILNVLICMRESISPKRVNPFYKGNPKRVTFIKKSEYSDEMLHNVAFNQGLHCM